MSSISLFTQAEALGDMNKGAASPPQGGGLRAQSRLLPRLGPWVMRIKLPLNHLKKVACELNLAFLPKLGPWVMRVNLLLHHLEEVACDLNLAFYPC